MLPRVSLLPSGKAGIAAFACGALVVLGAVWSLDLFAADSLAKLPLTANILAGLGWFPLELLVVYVIVVAIQERQRRRRWESVARELRSAIGTRWSRLRALLIARY